MRHVWTDRGSRLWGPGARLAAEAWMPSWAAVKRDRWAWGVVWTSRAIHGEARELTFGAQCLLGCPVLPRRLYQRASLGAPARRPHHVLVHVKLPASGLGTSARSRPFGQLGSRQGLFLF